MNTQIIENNVEGHNDKNQQPKELSEIYFYNLVENLTDSIQREDKKEVLIKDDLCVWVDSQKSNLDLGAIIDTAKEGNFLDDRERLRNIVKDALNIIILHEDFNIVIIFNSCTDCRLPFWEYNQTRYKLNAVSALCFYCYERHKRLLNGAKF